VAVGIKRPRQWQRLLLLLLPSPPLTRLRQAGTPECIEDVDDARLRSRASVNLERGSEEAKGRGGGRWAWEGRPGTEAPLSGRSLCSVRTWGSSHGRTPLMTVLFMLQAAQNNGAVAPTSLSSALLLRLPHE
jgi:hypothetical protein